jgi:hypothetical protein
VFPSSFEARGSASALAMLCNRRDRRSTPPRAQIEYTVALPYVRVVQSRGLRYPVKVFVDAQAGLLRLDLYDGLDSTFLSKVLPRSTPPREERATPLAQLHPPALALPPQPPQDAQYLVYPRINRMTCDVHNETAGPTGSGGGLLGAVQDAVRPRAARVARIPGCAATRPSWLPQPQPASPQLATLSQQHPVSASSSQAWQAAAPPPPPPLLPAGAAGPVRLDLLWHRKGGQGGRALLAAEREEPG